MKRSFLPLAAIASILALLAGVYASRPAESSPPPPAPPPRETPVARPAGAGGSAEACNVPLRWRIARIDSEFGLSAEEGGSAAWLWLPNGARYRGMAAFWAALAVAWPIVGDLLLAFYHLPGIRALQDAAYRWIATNRKHFPGGPAWLDNSEL